MSTTKAPWVVCYDGTQVHGKRPYSAECTRCGAVMDPPPVPIEVTKWVKAAKAFIDLHNGCKERQP